MSLNKMCCNLGIFDIPLIQSQPYFTVDLLDTNLMVFGSSMSGKTTLLKTLVNILHKQYNEQQEQIFILDFGAGLSDYKTFPLVSVYYDNSNEEYVKRVFKIMENILKQNIKELNNKNYRDTQQPIIHTTFIIDNLNSFINEPRYSAYQEKLAKLCREGLSKGITIVVTASETKGLNLYMGSFKQKVAFEMPQDKYSEIFTGKVGEITSNAGHGFANVTTKPDGVSGGFKMNLPYELQCTLPYKNDEDNTEDSENLFYENLKKKFEYINGEYSKCVKKYFTFPKELTLDEYKNIMQKKNDVISCNSLSVSVGLDYVEFSPVNIDLKQSSVISIYGKKEFGKTNLLNILIKEIANQKPDSKFVFLDDGRNQLKDIHEKYNNKNECIYINGFSERSIKLGARANRAEEIRTKKVSPFQQFILYLNDNHIEISDNVLAHFFDVYDMDIKRIESKKEYSDTKFTVFIIQSKLTYLNANESKYFIEKILPRMAAVAEDKGYLFIFSDVQKISDGDMNTVFNNTISTIFLFDNIAEFAAERGQKTVFGNMDIKTLKEDYARCEIGDGYYYGIESDNLLKAKFIKYEEE